MGNYRKIKESQTLLINRKSKILESQGKNLIRFGFGQSPFSPPKKVVKKLKRSASRKEYSSVQGDPELRFLISQFHKKHNNLSSKPENVLIGPGSKMLIFNILLSFQQADVLIPAPAWVSYGPQANLAGHHVIKLSTSFEDRWRITPQIIKKALSKKLLKPSILILNYPGNPEGLSYSARALKELAGFTRKHKITVISDEIYGLLDHENAHVSFANFYPEKTITTSGLSKWCGAGGWRFGIAMLPDHVKPKFKKSLIGICSETYSCAAVPVQEAAKIAYGEFKNAMDFVKKQNAILKEIGNYCSSQLSKAGIKTHAPEGAFYLLIDFSGSKKSFKRKSITSSSELCEQLLHDKSVALLPASAFGFEKNYLAARLAYVDFEDPLNKESFDLKLDCPKIVTGIKRIVDWIK